MERLKKTLNRLRISAVLISFVLAVWLACFGLDRHNILLWAISSFWAGVVMIAQLYIPEKKRHRRNGDTLQGQVERTINFAETQLK